MGKRYFAMKADQPLHVGQSYAFEYKDTHGELQQYYGKVESLGCLDVRIVCPSGSKHTLDLSTTTPYVDVWAEGVLEVRFIGSRWTLVVEQRDGKIVGSITGQSAHTTTYKLESYGLSGQSPFRKNHLPPESAEDVLAGMMRKWQRRL